MALKTYFVNQYLTMRKEVLHEHKLICQVREMLVISQEVPVLVLVSLSVGRKCEIYTNQNFPFVRYYSNLTSRLIKSSRQSRRN